MQQLILARAILHPAVRVIDEFPTAMLLFQRLSESHYHRLGMQPLVHMMTRYLA